jgi:hypothetical protein
MVTKGGGSGTPYYKKVVVDRGKGPHDVGLKEPLIGTLGPGSKKNQEGNQGESDRVGEEARESQNGTQETTNSRGVDGATHVKLKQH